MSMHADQIKTIVLAIGKSPRLTVTVSGTAVEYLTPIPLTQIAVAAASAAGYVTEGTPHVELFGSINQVKVTFPHYTK